MINKWIDECLSLAEIEALKKQVLACIAEKILEVMNARLRDRIFYNW